MPIELTASSAVRRGDVSLHRTSVVLSILFYLNLIAMPLKVYLSETWPFLLPVSFRQAASFPQFAPVMTLSLSSVYVTQLKLIYNHTTLEPGVVYWSDAVNDVEVMRTVITQSDDCVDTDHLVHSLLGVAYLTPDFKTAVVNAICRNSSSLDSVGRTWRLNSAGTRACTMAAWIVVGDDVVINTSTSDAAWTVYVTLVPDVKSMTWRLVKLTYRILVSLWIAFVSVRDYYLHVRHLHTTLAQVPLHRDARAVRYTIVLGEPTCLVLSNPYFCAAFVVDILTSNESIGVACLRICQTHNLTAFVLGSFYMSRLVWCGYWTLAMLNVALKRKKWMVSAPANTAVLAVAAFFTNGMLIYVQSRWLALLNVYASLFDLCSSHDPATNQTLSADAMLVLLVCMLTMCTLPFGINLASAWIESAALICRRSYVISSTSPRVASVTRRLSFRRKSQDKSPKPLVHLTESTLQFNDFKHRCMLWLCRVGDASNKLCTGGSIYPLFRHNPVLQAKSTISQRGGDCYVFGYDSADTLIEITRVSLVSQVAFETPSSSSSAVVPGPPSSGLSTEFAVGRLLVTDESHATAPSVVLLCGIHNSPWVA
ncbi:Aste57867_8105 [Aphanomyces stellatus]|uniref:Aste57867_8105 protein n=1 Tax=Aphanomyces stellatus TaxID=120398 RepID=A0A485KJD4_9STRA|nr:hypothetical protein As57867_008075 [Aphanomyces stellatus]VFT84994.1 Aste57867_8105 [Aphanomyces stellatus]